MVPEKPSEGQLPALPFFDDKRQEAIHRLFLRGKSPKEVAKITGLDLGEATLRLEQVVGEYTKMAMRIDEVWAQVGILRILRSAELRRDWLQNQVEREKLLARQEARIPDLGGWFKEIRKEEAKIYEINRDFLDDRERLLRRGAQDRKRQLDVLNIAEGQDLILTPQQRASQRFEEIIQGAVVASPADAASLLTDYNQQDR